MSIIQTKISSMLCFMARKNNPKVYVLMRVHGMYTDDSMEWKGLVGAVTSVYSQSYKNIVLLVQADMDKPSAKALKKRLLVELAKNKININEESLLWESEPVSSSAYGTKRLRDRFIKKANDNDIAVILDHDDILNGDNVVKKVVKHLKDNGANVCVTGFEVFNADNVANLSIKAGVLHNELLRRFKHRSKIGKFGFKICDLFSYYWFKFLLFLITNIIPLLLFFSERKWLAILSISSFLNKCSCKLDNVSCNLDNKLGVRYSVLPKINREDAIVYLDSLGWTKWYRKSILEKYHKSLVDVCSSIEGGNEESFFRLYKQYEDFVDIYSLLLKDTNVSYYNKKTHKYVKNKSSITSSPVIEDFEKNRVMYLSVLLSLLKKHSSDLKENANKIIGHFIVVKTLQIENILAKYRSDYYDGIISLSDSMKKVLSEIPYENIIRNTHYRWFTSLLHSKFTKIDNNYPILLNIDSYNKSDVKYSLGKAIEYESCIGVVDTNYISYTNVRQDTLEQQMIDMFEDNSESIKEKSKYVRYRDIAVITSILIFAFLMYEIEVKDWLQDWRRFLFSIPPIAITLFTWLWKQIVDIDAKIESEKMECAKYGAALEDLIRHLTANFKVMEKILDEMEKDNTYFPAKIHFQNLSIDPNSIILKQVPVKLTNYKNVNEFNRLAINCRNINNSADYLAALAVDVIKDRDKMMRAIKWEMARYIGYLINFYFFVYRNQFRFPSEDQVKLFSYDGEIRYKIRGLFLSKATDKDKYLDLYIDTYLKDRFESRNIV